jgi:transcriptional regulator with XRE-family HTH domain
VASLLRASTTKNESDIGEHLRALRLRRRLTQLELADALEISTRHLSFLETGRSRPSRAMVLRFAESLELPLRARNALLVAAGFAPTYPERPLSDPDLTAARRAIDVLLKGHEPYPAFAVDRHWTLIASNGGFHPFLKDIGFSRFTTPINVLSFTLHPHGLGPRLANHAQWRSHVLSKVRHQFELSRDPVLGALWEELRGYPAPPAAPGVSDDEGPFRGFAIPFQLRTEEGVLSFFTTTTLFGTPLEVTLSELSLECFYPADDSTAQALHRARPKQTQGPQPDAE